MPNTYVISYDLRGQRNYEELYQAIRSYGTWSRIVESTWAIVTDSSAVQIRDNLTQYLDRDDGIIVIRAKHEAAWKDALSTNEWLKKNL